jgi:hypothetical protein
LSAGAPGATAPAAAAPRGSGSGLPPTLPPTSEADARAACFGATPANGFVERGLTGNAVAAGDRAADVPPAGSTCATPLLCALEPHPESDAAPAVTVVTTATAIALHTIRRATVRLLDIRPEA